MGLRRRATYFSKDLQSAESNADKIPGFIMVFICMDLATDLVGISR